MNVKANNDLRMSAKGNGVPLWAIAERLSISEQTLIRHWRKELNDTEKAKIIAVIKQISGRVHSE